MNSTNTITLRKGSLIVFEGIDGTGKSTQLSLLHESLSKAGYSVVTTREPTQGKYGQRIRELYGNRNTVSREEELELFILDRKDHINSFLSPQLNDKKVVLCDRYFLSTIAYQGAAGLDIDFLKKSNDFAPKPDLALLLQLPPHASTSRITKDRGDTLNDFEQLESLKKVEKIFNTLSFPYIHRIDADRSIKDIHNEIYGVVEEYLKTITVYPDEL